MKQVEIINNWVIGYEGTSLVFFNYYDITGKNINVHDDLIVEFFDTQSEAITRLLALSIESFDVPIEISGLEIKSILREKIKLDNVLTHYLNGIAVYDNEVFTGYSQKQNPTKKYLEEKLNWITQHELDIQLITGYTPTDYVFSATVAVKKVKKNASFYDFATSLNNQITPRKKHKEKVTSYLIYLDANDGFSIDSEGGLINPYSDDIEIKQLTTNLKVNSKNQIVEA